MGNPLRLLLTAGQMADIDLAHDLIDGIDAKSVIADKGYDADRLVETLTARGAQAVIPPRSNRKTPRMFDAHLYKDRNLIERFFSRLKQFRRIATRYDKLASRFSSFIALTASLVWLA